MSFDKIMRALGRRPAPDKVREQLFWMVDLIYSCKTSQEPELVTHAALMEEALGNLGMFLETGDTTCLAQATEQIERFAAVIQRAIAMHRL